MGDTQADFTTAGLYQLRHLTSAGTATQWKRTDIWRAGIQDLRYSNWHPTGDTAGRRNVQGSLELAGTHRRIRLVLGARDLRITTSRAAANFWSPASQHYRAWAGSAPGMRARRPNPEWIRMLPGGYRHFLASGSTGQSRTTGPTRADLVAVR